MRVSVIIALGTASPGARNKDHDISTSLNLDSHD